MQIKMLKDAIGSANESGNVSKTYEKDEIIECNAQWQKDLGKIFVDSGIAEELKVVKPKETKKAKTTVKKKRKVVAKKD